ncbi:hypothetical protein [Streptomyces bottropensis]
MTNIGPAPWGADPDASWGRDDDGRPLVPASEHWTGPDAGAISAGA